MTWPSPFSGYVNNNGNVKIAHPTFHESTQAALKMRLGVRNNWSPFTWSPGDIRPTVDARWALQKIRCAAILERYPTRETFVSNLRHRWESRGHYVVESNEDALRIPIVVKGDLICTMKTISIPQLQEIRGSAYFAESDVTASLDALRSIGGDAHFTWITNANGLKSLKSIGGNAYFRSIVDPRDLNALDCIRGDAYFQGCYSNNKAVAMKVAEIVGGTLHLGVDSFRSINGASK
jgi:hypothetical protein